MSYTRTVLRTGARLLADQDDSDYPTDAQYNLWLDQAKKRVWHDLVTSGWPVNYTTQTLSPTGAAGVEHALTGIVFAVKAVYQISGTTRTPVPRVDPERRSTAAGQGISTSYEVLVDPTNGHVVRFFPPVAGTFEVEYLKETIDFTSDSDTWNGPGRTDELIMMLTAAKACRKEGRIQEAKVLMDDYRELLEEVRASASWVDMRNPAKIRDVYGSDSFGRDDFDFPVGSAY